MSCQSRNDSDEQVSSLTPFAGFASVNMVIARGPVPVRPFEVMAWGQNAFFSIDYHVVGERLQLLFVRIHPLSLSTKDYCLLAPVLKETAPSHR